MPFVNIRILEGHPQERKDEIARRVTETISEVAKLPKEAVWVVFEDVASDDWYVGEKRVSELQNPAAPPIPRPGVLAALLPAGLLAVAVLLVWHPGRSAEREITVGLKQAGVLARRVVERGGGSFFGYRSYTESRDDDTVRQFEGHQRLSLEDRRTLEAWRPASTFRHVLVSADHQERYEVHVSPTGRILSLRHGLRPDHTVVTIPPDSAAGIADAVLRNDLGLASDRLTASPPTEGFEEGRPIREFKWKSLDPLPGGTIGTVSIRLAGPIPIQAAVGAQFPAMVTRAIEEISNPVQNLANLVLSLVFITAVVLTVRRGGLIVIPGLRLFIALSGAFTVLFLTGQIKDASQTLVEEGSKGLVGDFIGFIWSAPLMGIILCVGAGFSLGVLSAEEPRSLAGLGQALRARISRATWARSALIGLPAGALCAAITVAVRHGLESIGVAYSVPGGYDNIFDAGAPGLVNQFFAAFLFWFAFASLMAAVALLRPVLRIGGWIWPAGVLLLSLAITGRSDLGYQPYQLNVVLMAAAMAPLLWISLRHGLLAGLAAGFSWQLLELVRRMAALPIPDLRDEAALYLAVWLILLVAALFTVRPWRKSPPAGEVRQAGSAAAR